MAYSQNSQHDNQSSSRTLKQANCTRARRKLRARASALSIALGRWFSNRTSDDLRRVLHLPPTLDRRQL
jgi:hypothetical protein